MMKQEKCIGVILASGEGIRFGAGEPKQYIKVAGKTILEHTVDMFESSPVIDEIAVVVSSGYMRVVEDMALINDWKKVKKILLGGKERYLSTLAAIRAFEQTIECRLIFHDAVRPLLSQRVLQDVYDALNKYDAVDVAIPASDTIIQLSEDGQLIDSIPNRKHVYQGQTPQAFRMSILKKAYDLALKDPAFRTTDDCGVVVKYLPNTPIYVVQGERRNIKLTHIEDLHQMDKLFQLNTISASFDYSIFSNLEGKVLMVFGGGDGIGKSLCELAMEYKMRVYSFSRSTTGTNITNTKDIQKAFEIVSDKEKLIDFVVLTAAQLRKEPFHMMTQNAINEMIDINFRGMIYVSQYAYKHLAKSNGQLLHFTSSSYTLGRPYYSLYSSSKAAVVNFVQALSQEWGTVGIRVNCMNPERTNTTMRTKNFGYEDEETLLSPKVVAKYALGTLLSKYSGQVVDVRKSFLNKELL